MEKLKMFTVDMNIEGSGWIEVLAFDEEEARKKIDAGCGVQKCDEWSCQDYDLDSIRDNGEVDEGDIEGYIKETGEELER